MYCKKCGKRLDKDAISCDRCEKASGDSGNLEKPYTEDAPKAVREEEDDDKERDGKEEQSGDDEGHDSDDETDEEYEDDEDIDDDDDDEDYYDEADREDDAHKGRNQRRAQTGGTGRTGTGKKPKKWLTALLLAILLGGIGAHRFYLGYHKSALLIILLVFVLGVPTAGLSEIIAGVWILVDCVLIAIRRMTTADGEPLVK